MSASKMRLQKELEMLTSSPSPGVSAWVEGDDLTRLGAMIIGPDDSPYEKGCFSLSIEIPLRYPFEPPRVRFNTPIYHPNIDSEGRICLDTLKMPPQGSWSPSVNINTLLLTIRLLMGSPNADDGLMPDITELYRRDIIQFKRLAREHALANAVDQDISIGCKAMTTSTAADVAVDEDIEEDDASRLEGDRLVEAEAITSASPALSVGEKRSVVLREYGTDEPRPKDQKLR